MSRPLPDSVSWCLRLTVALQCTGMAGRYLFSANESESDVYGLLYFDRDWAEPTALAIDNVGHWFCFVAGLLALFVIPARRDESSAARGAMQVLGTLVGGIALAGIGAWFLATGLAHQLRGGAFAEWTLVEHAVRYTAPLGLLLLLGSGRLATTPRVLLRLAAAATFIGHGYVALQHHGHFVDLLLHTDARWFGLGLTQSSAETLLTWIGWLDIGVAAALLFLPWRLSLPAAYMAVWGAITASSRMTALGVGAWPETAVRAANCGVPLALLLAIWACHATDDDESSASSNP